MMGEPSELDHSTLYRDRKGVTTLLYATRAAQPVGLMTADPSLQLLLVCITVRSSTDAHLQYCLSLTQ